MLSNNLNTKKKPEEEELRHILEIEHGEEKQTVHLKDRNYSIGRHPTNAIVIASQQVSRTHAILLRKGYANENISFLLIDGDLQGRKSNNGIFINGKKIHEHELKHGDLIQIGTDVKANYYIYHVSVSLKTKTHNNDSLRCKLFLEEETEVKGYDEICEKELNYPNLRRLASFADLSPNPIVEINQNGEITYQNLAANKKFPNLHKRKLFHPLFKDLSLEPINIHGNVSKKEITIEKEVFEQYIHYLAEDKLIRLYIFDITEHKLSKKKLEYQAHYDLQTGLPNRAYFNERLSKTIQLAKKHHKKMAVMFLDLDRFKKINDTLGHKAGDSLLKNFAKRFKSSLPKNGFVARWGGDEFTVLLTEIENIEEASKIARRILQEVKKPFEIEGQAFYVTSSIGIAIYPENGKEVDTLIKNADSALYLAKRNGRNNYRFYSPSIQVKSSESLKLENSLHTALENQEFLLYYQPQMNLKTKEICGFEALLRWNHPEKGLISPNRFIPIAEDTGLIIPIGEWILKTACNQMLTWQKAAFPFGKISVNISARQFQQSNFVVKIAEILKETNFNPEYLELEITETTVIENVDYVIKTLKQLLRLGVSISMDDFGTGYSSLSYLKKFPFHTIKIDRSFVNDLKDNSKDQEIISAVIAIGHCLKMKVIAEGVETIDQRELLHSLNCDEIQGYWLSKPLPPEDVPSFFLNFPEKLKNYNHKVIPMDLIRQKKNHAQDFK